jgi:small subunit ribosomal protein S9
VAEKVAVYSATGSRKNAVARVNLTPGAGKWTVNGKEPMIYFGTEAVLRFVEQPMKLTDMLEKFDLNATLKGGGIVGQAGALRHAIARALILSDATLRGVLKGSGCLTRDARMKERKKYGQPGARKRFQFSKR